MLILLKNHSYIENVLYISKYTYVQVITVTYILMSHHIW